MNFTTCGAGPAVEGYCLIKSVDKKLTAKGVPYLDMILADSSDEVVAKLWDYRETPDNVFEISDLVKVRGTMVPFNDTMQFRVERIRHVTEADGVRIEDYVPSAELDGQTMFDIISGIVDGFKDENLKKLVKCVMEKHKEKLIFWPAALRLHHAVRSGLLYHTLSIIRLAQSVAKIYSAIDSDLLIAGAILHDVAKTAEINVSSAGIATDYSVQGNLLGHLVMGAIEISHVGRENGVDENTLMLVEHMLISHHGDPEFGAAVRPMFLEAEVLSELDMLDSRIYEITHAVDEIGEGEFTPRQWALDNRKLYNHGRNGNNGVNLK